jgi:hypothetical protein
MLDPLENIDHDQVSYAKLTVLECQAPVIEPGVWRMASPASAKFGLGAEDVIQPI